MNIQMILGVAAFILVVGGVVAVAWWKLAAKAAPYKDELARQKAREESGRDEHVVVLESPVKPKSH